MMPPTKAFILAAGLGTRLRPLTHLTPKPLVPIWGVPVLTHTLRTLKKWGVREVVINVHSHLDQFHQFVREARSLNLRIQISYEAIVLDTGGALRKAAWFFDHMPFWLVNGDIVFDVNPTPFLSAYEQARSSLAILWCTDKRGPRTVEIDDCNIKTFRSKKPLTPGTYTFCGLHLLSPRVLAFIPKQEPHSIIDAYTRAMELGERIQGIESPHHYWADIGTLSTYLSTHRDIADAFVNKLPGSRLLDPLTWSYSRALSRKGIKIRGLVVASQFTSIERGASLHDTVIWDGSRINSNARLSTAVVADATLSGPSQASGAIVSLSGSGFPAPMLRALKSHGFPDRTAVIPFPPRGSARSFFRLQHDKQTSILICYDKSRQENKLHAGHTLFLQHAGIPVPNILANSPRGRWCLMQDCGDISLLELVKHSTNKDRLCRYREVLDKVSELHSSRILAQLKKRGRHLAPGFSDSLYRWEHALFLTNFVNPQVTDRPGTISRLQHELSWISNRLGKEPRCLIHRDLQSSNIIFTDEKPIFIDYQGMRLGPAIYDIASLLADPYVSLPHSEQMQLLTYYAERTHQSFDHIRPVYFTAAIQRLCQALGAYGRLTALGLQSFKAHIRPALMLLDHVLMESDNNSVLAGFVRRVLNSDNHDAQEGQT